MCTPSALRGLQQRFTEQMYPTICRVAGHRLRHLLQERRRQRYHEDVADTAGWVWLFARRLHEKGVDPVPQTFRLIRVALNRVWRRDPLAGRADRGTGGPRRSTSCVLGCDSRCRRFRVNPFDERCVRPPWRRRSESSVLAQVEMHLDFRRWAESLPLAEQQTAYLLALGHTTGETVRQLNVSYPCVSNRRRRLAQSWRRFHGSK